MIPREMVAGKEVLAIAEEALQTAMPFTVTPQASVFMIVPLTDREAAALAAHPSYYQVVEQQSALSVLDRLLEASIEFSIVTAWQGQLQLVAIITNYQHQAILDAAVRPT